MKTPTNPCRMAATSARRPSQYFRFSLCGKLLPCEVMNFKLIRVIAALSLFAFGASAETRLSDFIRPFVGTEGEGNTYPGPSAPFGMMQLSPDTDTTNWSTASGYDDTDPTIHGF